VGPRGGLDDSEDENSCPHQDSNSGPLVIQPVVSRYAHCTILALPLQYMLVKFETALQYKQNLCHQSVNIA
jgi:hypothetical protein